MSGMINTDSEISFEKSELIQLMLCLQRIIDQ